MSVSKKPRKGTSSTLNEFLGTSSISTPVDKERIYHQSVRIEQKYIDQIDELCQQRRVKTARHAWLLEAIFEKMDREQNA